MKAIIQTDQSDPSALEWKDAPDPEVSDGQALIKIEYAGLNRADTLQAQGHYPPPQGDTEIIGLEAAGTIVDPNGATKTDGSPWKEGEEVGVLLTGGGYAQYAAVPHGQIFPIPDTFTLEETASVIEVAATTWSNLMMVAHIEPGDLVLIHGGGGGIGLFAIQLAKAQRAKVAVTAGSAEKLNVCKRYGADVLINYKEDDFVKIVKDHGGADVILDIIGAKYLEQNVQALAKDGHMVTIGLQGGVKGELNLARLLNKRGTISATSLRYRDIDDKADIVADTIKNVWPMLANGKISHHIDRMFPIHEAAEAHKALLDGKITGKVVFDIPHED